MKSRVKRGLKHGQEHWSLNQLHSVLILQGRGLGKLHRLYTVYEMQQQSCKKAVKKKKTALNTKAKIDKRSSKSCIYVLI